MPTNAPTILEQQAVLGVFTHRTKYLPAYLESVRDHLPHIPLIVKMRNGKIQENWDALRLDMLSTDKRYLVFTDDDIKFLDSTIIHDCVAMMIDQKLGACGVYSFYDAANEIVQANWIKITPRKVNWLPGYFIMIDREKVGDIQPDQNLPWDNFGDAVYCREIAARGYEIGLCPHIVQHEPAKRQPNFEHEAETMAYLDQKFGGFYKDFLSYGGNVLDWGLAP